MKKDEKILVTDDSLFARKIIKDILTRNGYNNIIEAADGIEAVEKYEKEKPKLVIMDLIMDKMDGVEALEKIMEEDKNAQIIVASAVGQDTIVNQCMKLGSKGFVIKPVDEKKLLIEINKLVSKDSD